MTDELETKKTKTHDLPEPIGILPAFGPVFGADVFLYECPLCVSVVTSLQGHYVLQHPEAAPDS